MSDSKIKNMSGAYSVILRATLEDKTLNDSSVRALAWMLSHDTEKWVIRVSDLQARLGFKRKRWVTARDQLVAAGYLRIEKNRSANGRYTYTYFVHREPNNGF